MGSVVETAASSLDGFNTGFTICGVITLVGGVIGMMVMRPARDDAVGEQNTRDGSWTLAEEAHKFALMGERCWSRISTSLWATPTSSWPDANRRRADVCGSIRPAR